MRWLASGGREAEERLVLNSLRPFVTGILGQAVSLSGFFLLVGLLLLVGTGIWKLLLRAPG